MLDMEDNVVTENEVSPDSMQVVIPWFGLQKVLLDHCWTNNNNNNNDDGSISFKLGHELISLEEEEDCILLTFSNGDQYRASVVIGADGNLSKVRSILFEEESEPEYAGSCIWRIFLQGDYPEIQLAESNV